MGRGSDVAVTQHACTMMVQVVVTVIVVPVTVMPVAGPGGHALDPDVSLVASAHRAHQRTSSSLILISSPPVTCSRWLPQTGHGS